MISKPRQETVLHIGGFAYQPLYCARRALHHRDCRDVPLKHAMNLHHFISSSPSLFRYQGGFFYPAGDDGNYDMTGEGAGAGFNINVPWPGAGFSDADYLAAWEHVLLPVARSYAPDIILISAGFDAGALTMHAPDTYGIMCKPP